MMIKWKMLVIVFLLLGAVVFFSGCIHSYSDEQVLCGKITFLTDKTLGEIPNVVVIQIDGDVFAVEEISDKDYAVLSFAYSHNCNVSMIIQDHKTEIETIKMVVDGSVVLLDCGDKL